MAFLDHAFDINQGSFKTLTSIVFLAKGLWQALGFFDLVVFDLIFLSYVHSF